MSSFSLALQTAINSFLRGSLFPYVNIHGMRILIEGLDGGYLGSVVLLDAFTWSRVP